MWARRLFLRLVIATGSISCLAILAAWGASTVREGGVLVRDWHGARLVEVRHGVFHSRYDRTSRYFNYPTERIWAPVEFHLAAAWGYNVGKEVKPFKTDFQGIVDFRLPLVFPSLAVLGLVVLAAWRLRWITRRGHCRQCGYNLTGNRSGICSECGTAILATSLAARTEVQQSTDQTPAPSTPVAIPVEQPQRRWPLRVACTLATAAMLTWTAGLSISFIEHWREMRHRDPELDAANPPGEIEAVRLTKWELKQSGRHAYLHKVEPFVLNNEWHVDCTSEADDLVRFRMDASTGRLIEVAVPSVNNYGGRWLSPSFPSQGMAALRSVLPPPVPQDAEAFPRFHAFLEAQHLSDSLWAITTFVLSDDYYVLCVTRLRDNLPRETKLYKSKNAKDEFQEVANKNEILTRAGIDFSGVK